jgi:hypothetical protein
MEERTVHLDVPVVTNQQSSKIAEPSEGSLDFPPSLVSSQLSTILHGRFASVGPVRADQVDAPLFQPISQRIRVRRLVVNQPLRLVSGPAASGSRNRDSAQCFFDERDFVGRGRVEVNSQRNTLAVAHHHPLCTLAAFSFSNTCAPFFAGANEPSANVSSQSSKPAASNSPRNFRQILSQTSCSSHLHNRRQQVLGDGKSFGKSCQRAPLRRTQRMPSRQSRSLAGGRPPRRERLNLGRSGRIVSHCASVSSLLVMANPFASQVNHKMMRRANLAATRF